MGGSGGNLGTNSGYPSFNSLLAFVSAFVSLC